MQARSQHNFRRRLRRWAFGLAVVFVVGGLTASYLRPLPAVAAHVRALPDVSARQVAVSWPAAGQAAIGAQGFGLLASHNAVSPAATASIAKIITTLCVLQKHPLAANQSGPMLTMSAADVSIYNAYIAKDGSSVPVQAGEQLTEYQMLEGMLIPSGNNLADSLAIWAFGSLSAYASYANQFLADNGLAHTHVGLDASGYDPSTTSTASDLVKLGMLALQQPAITSIVSRSQATLPIAGTVYNYNWVLGKGGIDGIKTGNNNKDLGAFLFSAKIPVGDTQLTVVGAVMNQRSLRAALNAALPLVASLKAGFEQKTIVAAGQTVANYTAPWGAKAQAVAGKAIDPVSWKGTAGNMREKVNDIIAGQKPDVVGSIIYSAGSMKVPTTVKLKQQLAGPSFWWRLTRH